MSNIAINRVETVPESLRRVVMPKDTMILPRLEGMRVVEVIDQSVGKVFRESGVVEFAGVCQHPGTNGKASVVGRSEKIGGHLVSTGKVSFGRWEEVEYAEPEVHFAIGEVAFDERTIYDAMVAFELQIGGSLNKGERRRLIANYREHFGALAKMEELNGEVIVSVSDLDDSNRAANQLCQIELLPEAERQAFIDDVEFFLPRSRQNIERFGEITPPRSTDRVGAPLVRALISA